MAFIPDLTEEPVVLTEEEYIQQFNYRAWRHFVHGMLLIDRKNEWIEPNIPEKLKR